MNRQKYNFITLNLNGLHNPIKRSKVIAKMKREKQDVIFWQETHLLNDEHEKLKRMGFKHTYYSSFKKGNSRGVAILISNNVNFQFSSQITDKEGCYVLVKGFIDHKEVTLLNVYRPPGSDRQLIKKVFDLICLETSGVLICGGDWNINLHPSLDSSNNSKRMQPEALYVKKMLKESGMIDIWRDLHPGEKSFTFFSNPHSMFSRLDYFFLFNSDRHRVFECNIGVRDVSDHAGVYLILHLDIRRKETLWRLNSSFLNETKFLKYVEEEFKSYMSHNDNGEVSPSVLWDAAKAVLRGKVIMWSSIRKKEKEKQIQDMVIKLKCLEEEHMKTNNDNILKQLLCTRRTLNELYENQIEKKAKFLKQNYYENGPKAKKLLAWRARKQQANRYIHKIKNPQTNKIQHNLEDIQQSFVAYYSNLYSQPPAADLILVDRFLASLDLPSIGTEQNKMLTQQITEKEINKIISNLKGSKMPGPDGFPSEWYKSFRHTTILLLKSCFNHVLGGGAPPPSWKQAIISIIPKTGKDATECSSYRPISVLNIDYKIFATILAKRLENIIPELIDTDQTGFVKNRQTHDNVRRALHLIGHMKTIESVALSLDAEKAFDAVRWEFLYSVLKRFGFNGQVIDCLRSLYTLPVARIKVNGDLSDLVSLERGCRQGCPLSPALFALFIEPLAQAIRELEDVAGIILHGSEHKVCLYADDVLVTLTKPDKTLPPLLSLLNTFGSYSGYKLNLHKTQILTFNYIPNKTILNILKGNWSNSLIKYLGVQLPKDLNDIYKYNYIPLTTNIKADLNRWSLLPMNMYNRIELIKMIVLPRLLYLFLALPVEVPSKQFIEWNRMISNFIWGKQRPRIKYDTMQLARNEGGMALPCLQNYYKAAQLRVLIAWCDPTCDARWKEIDQAEVHIPLPSILGDKPLLQLLLNKVSSWIKVPLSIWLKELRDKTNEEDAKTLRWPAYDTDFTPAKNDSSFKRWCNKGITAYWKISSEKGLDTFQQLSDSYNLGKDDFFRYLQLRHHFNANISKSQDRKPLINIFLDACKGKLSKKQISKTYSVLQKEKKLSTIYIKLKWEKEAKIDIPEEDWLNICKTIATTSSSDLWREFTWKNTVRFFITPRVKELQNKNVEHGKCWRKCGITSVGHFHIFWECPKISPYWTDVVKTIQLIMGLQLEETFIVFYLGNIPTGLTKRDRYLLQILQAASKKAITRKWLNEEPPTVLEWMDITHELYVMERLTFSLRHSLEKGEQYWKKWKYFLSKKSH